MGNLLPVSLGMLESSLFSFSCVEYIIFRECQQNTIGTRFFMGNRLFTKNQRGISKFFLLILLLTIIRNSAIVMTVF